MVAVAGLALVFWLMFARDEGTVLAAVFGYLLFSVLMLVVLPLFLFNRRCPHCDERAMRCMGVILFRPPLGSYYCCVNCLNEFRGRVLHRWVALEKPLPARFSPARRGRAVWDPWVWYTDPLERKTRQATISFAEDSES